MDQKYVEASNIGWMRQFKRNAEDLQELANVVLRHIGRVVENDGGVLRGGLLGIHVDADQEPQIQLPGRIASLVTPVSEGVARIRWSLGERDVQADIEIVRKNVLPDGEVRWEPVFSIGLDSDESVYLPMGDGTRQKVSLTDGAPRALSDLYFGIGFNIFRALVHNA